MIYSELFWKIALKLFAERFKIYDYLSVIFVQCCDMYKFFVLDISFHKAHAMSLM